MLSAFGKPGLVLVCVGAFSAIAVAIAPARPSKPFAAWVFDPSSARSYDSLGDVDVDLVPARLLGVRAVAAALAGQACAADVIELEAGSSRRGLQTVPQPLEALLAPDLPPSRLDLWRDDTSLMAIPRDINPVVLAYDAAAWDAAGVDLNAVYTWSEFFTACQALEASTPGMRSVELPRGNAAVLSLMLQQQGVDLRGGLDQKPVSEWIEQYVRWARTGVGIEPSRRVEGTAAAFDAGKLAAVIVPDWRLGQLRRLAKTPLKIRLLPGDGNTPTWGGTGVGIPRFAHDPSRSATLIARVTSDASSQHVRFIADGIVPVFQPARDATLAEETNAAEAHVWREASNTVVPAPVSGEPTAAIQRELNAVLRWAIASNATEPAIRLQLRAAAARLKLKFPKREAQR